jgi:hypothetical protein
MPLVDLDGQFNLYLEGKQQGQRPAVGPEKPPFALIK